MRTLLIRSQGKTILIKMPDMLYVGDHDAIYANDQFFPLGKYNSKERAMQVLDEIQEAYIKSITINESCVYQMPTA